MLPGHILLVFVLLTSSVLCLELKVIYHEETDVIRVKIEASNSNYSFYHLELSMNGCSAKNKTIIKQTTLQSHEVAETNFYGPFLKNSSYCVLVTPLTMRNKIECQTPCQPEFKELYISSQDKLHCEKWNTYPDTETERNLDGTYQMRVKLNVDSPFQSCFTRINVSLWNGVHNVCDALSGDKVDQKTVKVTPDHEETAVFGDLKPGNYCIRLYPIHSSCEDICFVRYTGLTNLTNITPVADHFSSGADTEASSLIYIVAGCVIFIVIIIAAVSTCYCKGLDIRFLTSANEKGLTLEDLIKLAKNRAQRLEIVLLNSRDFEEHSDVVVALYHFLLHCFGVRSVRFDMEEELTISVNLDSWVENISDPTSNRVFLVIESEGAVLQENGRRSLKLLRPENEDRLDDVFPYALQILKAGTRGLCDYETVFVAKFEYTPDDLRLNFMVPNRRYTLPKHLFELYCTLLNLPNPSIEVFKSFKYKMIKEWQGSFLEDLITKIQDASTIINKNPRMIKDYFVEQDLFPSVSKNGSCSV